MTMKITLQQARSFPIKTRQGFCARGMRQFADRYGLDWEQFIREGLDEEVLLATNDAQARRLVDWVKANAQ
jgi:hypothetical protein